MKLVDWPSAGYQKEFEVPQILHLWTRNIRKRPPFWISLFLMIPSLYLTALCNSDESAWAAVWLPFLGASHEAWPSSPPQTWHLQEGVSSGALGESAEDQNKTCTHFTEHVKSVDCSCQRPSSVLQIQTSTSALTTWVKRLPSCFRGDRKWHLRPRRWVPWGFSSCASGQGNKGK